MRPTPPPKAALSDSERINDTDVIIPEIYYFRQSRYTRYAKFSFWIALRCILTVYFSYVTRFVG